MQLNQDGWHSELWVPREAAAALQLPCSAASSTLQLVLHYSQSLPASWNIQWNAADHTLGPGWAELVNPTLYPLMRIPLYAPSPSHVSISVIGHSAQHILLLNTGGQPWCCAGGQCAAMALLWRCCDSVPYQAPAQNTRGELCAILGTALGLQIAHILSSCRNRSLSCRHLCRNSTDSPASAIERA